MIRQRAARYALAALAGAAVLSVPSTANAWSWGYNYIGASTNSYVYAGWNYWSYAYADKKNGGEIFRQWQTQAGNYCDDYISGTRTYTSYPSDCGFGGYLYLYWGYISGNPSYVYLEAN